MAGKIIMGKIMEMKRWWWYEDNDNDDGYDKSNIQR